MAVLFLIACCLLSSSLASPLIDTKNKEDCSATLKAAGLSDKFPGIVAHGIHSITVEQLRQFKPDVTEKNSIPTVNMDLLSDAPILFHAPNEPDVGKSFKTDGMRALDQVLSHMDNPKYDIGQYSTLERVVHSMHMQEVWYEVRSAYEKLKQQLPSTDACKCALDVENNGVLRGLRSIALQVREPELVIGKHTTLKNGTVSWRGNLYLHKFDFLLKKEAEIPIGWGWGSDASSTINSEAAWTEWKKRFMSMTASDNIELAFYLYCALDA